MTLAGTGPVFDMMRKEAARQKAQRDHAYSEEMTKLGTASGTSTPCPHCDGTGYKPTQQEPCVPHPAAHRATA